MNPTVYVRLIFPQEAPISWFHTFSPIKSYSLSAFHTPDSSLYFQVLCSLVSFSLKAPPPSEVATQRQALQGHHWLMPASLTDAGVSAARLQVHVARSTAHSPCLTLPVCG